MGPRVLLVAAFVTFLCGDQARAALTVQPTYLRASLGEMVTSICTVSGGETFLGWYKDNKRISESASASVHFISNGNQHTLKLVGVKVSYGGTYECRGNLNKAVTLTLQIGADVSKVEALQFIKIGTTDKIGLGVSGYPKPTFEWKKGSKVLQPSSDSHYSLQTDGSLSVKNVKLEDQGNYTCLIMQPGYTKRAEIEVYAVELPKITPFSSPRKYLTKGYSVSFVCKAKGIPAPKYTWYFKGNQINTVGNNLIKEGNLTITEVTSSSKGEYQCKAYNEIKKPGQPAVKIGEDTTTVEIVDVYVAPGITSDGTDKILSGGQKFTLECKATGSPTPTVVWKRNGEIDPRQKKSEGKSVISFPRIAVSDGGKYTCEARNNAVDSKGKTIVTTLVRNINIKSAPYINKHASPSEVFSFIGNLDLTFVSCTFGGYPPPFVTMTFNGKLVSNDSVTANTSVRTDAKKKFGLFVCHAKNDYGFKNQTVLLKQVEKPSVVRDLRGTSTCDSVTLTWKPPLTDGGMPINKYVLQYGEKSKTRNIDQRKTSYTITNLERNKVHNFILRATNKGEWGDTTSKEVETKQFCAPGRPIIYEPSSRNLDVSSFTLKWKRPEDTGGDSDIVYKIRYRDETDPDRPGPWNTEETSELEVDIEDLDKSKQYKFEVRATNKGGESEPAEKYIWRSSTEAQSSQPHLVASLTVTLFMAILQLRML